MSAPYHTQHCNGIDCQCLQDHLQWVEECESPASFDAIWAWAWAVVIFMIFCTMAVLAGLYGYFLGPR